MNNTPPVSVLVLTFNEAINIERCLKSVAWSDDVVVLDSYSSDNTVDLARKNGAQIFERKFDNFASQRNWALENVQWRYPWVLHLDADEVVTDALVGEIEEAVHTRSYDCYQIPSKLMWETTWLRFSGMYPVYQVRLGKSDRLRFAQVGHGQREIADGLKVGTLKEPYLHYGFSKGLDDWCRRHEHYAQDEAAESLHQAKQKSIDWAALLSISDKTSRRRALKQVSMRLPTRPALRFFYMYVLRGGFLDGSKGFQYCRLLAQYEAQIVANITIAKRKAQSQGPLGTHAGD